MSHSRDQPRERRFPAPRGSPKDHRADFVLLDLSPQRFSRPEQSLLPCELVERARPHPFRERLADAGVFVRLEFCEQAHVCPCRWASNSNTLPAIAAFSDSIPTGAVAAACGIYTRASAARTRSAGRPEPSLPIKMAAGPCQSTSHGRNKGEAASAA